MFTAYTKLEDRIVTELSWMVPTLPVPPPPRMKARAYRGSAIISVTGTGTGTSANSLSDHHEASSTDSSHRKRGKKKRGTTTKRCISAFRPGTNNELCEGLLRNNMEVRGVLMEEVVEGFLRWRERKKKVLQMRVLGAAAAAGVDADGSGIGIENKGRRIVMDPLDVRSLIRLTLDVLSIPFARHMHLQSSTEVSFIAAFIAGVGVGWMVANTNN